MSIELNFTCAYEYTDKDGYGISEWCGRLFTSEITLVNNSHLVSGRNPDTEPTINAYVTCPYCDNTHELEFDIKSTNGDVVLGDQII